jgi:RNA polymerase sigma factor (TIGR02999 family)
MPDSKNPNPGPSGKESPTNEARTEAGDVTILLRRVADGDRDALDSLFEAVYGELQRLAHAQRDRWTGDRTLNTTALVHEAYLRLARHGGPRWNDRQHFYAVASRAMRQILVNYAERRLAEKRGGQAEMVPLDQANPVAPEAALEIVALHDALSRLAEFDERQSRVVEYRFFAGMPVSDTAELLGISQATVKRDWTLASAWLRREMSFTLSDVGGGE